MKESKKLILSFLLVLSLILTACGGGGGGGSVSTIPTAPTDTVVSGSSINNNSNVSVKLDAIQIKFSKSMDPSSTKAAFHITPALSGILNVSGSDLTFNITENLKPGTNYKITIDTSAKDVDGISLKSQYSLSFRTEGASANAPSAISDLSVVSGDVFGNVKLSFTGPVSGTDPMSAYLVKYGSVTINESNFGSSSALPSSITLPTPTSGTNEIINIPTNLLTSVGPDEKIYFAVKTTTTTGYSSNISNVVSINKPWAMSIKVVDKSDSSNSPTMYGNQTLWIGNQKGATDNLDKYDTEFLPLPGLNIYTTLTGRSERLIRDIRDIFPTSQDNSEIYHVVISGNSNTKVKLEFPQFSSITPFYDYKIKWDGTGEITLTGQTLGSDSDDIVLNGSGLFEFDLTISN